MQTDNFNAVFILVAVKFAALDIMQMKNMVFYLESVYVIVASINLSEDLMNRG